jgi:hypothetical protein
MRRRVLTILAAMSAIVFFLAAGMRVRAVTTSNWASYTSWNESACQINYYSSGWYGAYFMMHRRQVGDVNSKGLKGARLGWVYGSSRRFRPGDAPWPWFHFTHEKNLGRMAGTSELHPLENWQLDIRLWPVILLSAIIPLLWTRVFLRERRRKRVGLCPVCGYDLRESPQRCPECGTASTATTPISPAN